MVKLFSNYLTVSPLYLGSYLLPPHMVHQFVLKISVRRSSQFLPCQNSCEGLHYVDSEKSSQHLSKESRREENLTVFLMSMCPSLSTSTQNMEFYWKQIFLKIRLTFPSITSSDLNISLVAGWRRMELRWETWEGETINKNANIIFPPFFVSFQPSPQRILVKATANKSVP